MIRRSPRATRTATFFPYTTFLRSALGTRAGNSRIHCAVEAHACDSIRPGRGYARACADCVALSLDFRRLPDRDDFRHRYGEPVHIELHLAVDVRHLADRAGEAGLGGQSDAIAVLGDHLHGVGTVRDLVSLTVPAVPGDALDADRKSTRLNS